MNIRNKIVNYWYNLDLVSHLDQDGKVKPIQEYTQEINQVIADIYREHAALLKDAQDGSLVKFFTTLGKLLSGNISFNYQKLSPIDHYDKRGCLKTQQKFKEDLKDYLETVVYARHKDMIDYDNASYLELIGYHSAKSITSFVDSVNLLPESFSEVQESLLNIGGTIYHSVTATSYVIAGTCTLGLNIANSVYGVGQYIVSSAGQYTAPNLETVKDKINILELKDFGSAVGTLGLNIANSSAGQCTASNLETVKDKINILELKDFGSAVGTLGLNIANSSAGQCTASNLETVKDKINILELKDFGSAVGTLGLNIANSSAGQCTASNLETVKDKINILELKDFGSAVGTLGLNIANSSAEQYTASYLELIGYHSAKSITSFVDSILHSLTATSYVIAGTCTLGLNIANSVYGAGQYIVSSAGQYTASNLETIKDKIDTQYNSTFSDANSSELVLLGTSNFLEVLAP